MNYFERPWRYIVMIELLSCPILITFTYGLIILLDWISGQHPFGQHNLLASVVLATTGQIWSLLKGLRNL